MSDGFINNSHVKKCLVSILFLLSGCQKESLLIHGYIEGDYVYVSPASSGILQSIRIKEGDTIHKGDTLFALDSAPLESSVKSAQAVHEKSVNQLENLKSGQRPQELEVIQKQALEAQVVFENAAKEYQRAKALVGSGALSQLEFDNRESTFRATKANLEVVKAQLQAAQLAARDAEIKAAKSQLLIDEQSVIQAQYQAEKSAPVAPADARVEDVFFEQGEFILQGQPVVSLLPPENLKVLFYVSQKELARIKAGQQISVSCDGCSQSFKAGITYVADKAEYSPPVIYSIESREKLVFRVEARPDSGSENISDILKPGLPVDIDPGEHHE